MTQEHGRGRIIKRAIKALRFVETYPRWTVEDLADELGIEIRNAQDWVHCLQEVMPIEQFRQYRPLRGRGGLAALYGKKEKQDGVTRI